MATSLFQTSDAYLAQMLDRAQALGSRISDFNTGSTARTLYECLAVGLSAQSGVVDQLRLNAYLATATGDALDDKAADFQVQRNAAVAAVGTITISRAAAGAAVTIPAGWAPLQTVPAAGQQPVQVITTADAVFAGSDLSKTVAAVAVNPGIAGNLLAGTPLLPLNPIAGFQTSGGFAVSGTSWTNGVDAETDDALRTRVPIAVQGRVKGRKEAFLAAVLGVPGVVSGNVLRAGDARGDSTTVPTGAVEVYWEGSSTLAAPVANAVAGAAQLNQSASAIAATLVDLVFHATVYCAAGVNTTALNANVVNAAIAAVAAFPVGAVVRQSAVVQAIHALPDVIAVSLPFSDLRRSSDTSGTAGDVTLKPIEYARLLAANVAITVTPLS